MKSCLINSLLIICLLCTANNGWAQEADFLKDKQSKTEKIEKARNLLLDYVINFNRSSIEATYAYLVSEEDENYVTLFPTEKWMINYLMGDFHEVLKDLYLLGEANFENKSYQVFPKEDYLTKMLIKKIQERDDSIASEIQEIAIPAIDKDFLSLHLHFLQANEIYSISQDMLNEEANTYLKEFHESPYNYFVREFIHYSLKPSNWAFGIEYFFGYGLLTEELKRDYGNPVPLGFSIDFLYNRFTLSSRLAVGIITIKKEKTINNLVWSKDTGANIGIFEGAISYKVAPIDKPFNFAPFMGIAVMNIEPNTVTKEDYPELADAGLDYTTNYTFGAQMDYNFSVANVPSYGINSSNKLLQYQWFFRLRYQYNIPQFEKKYPTETGQYHSITLGIGFNICSLKRSQL